MKYWRLTRKKKQVLKARQRQEMHWTFEPATSFYKVLFCDDYKCDIVQFENVVAYIFCKTKIGKF